MIRRHGERRCTGGQRRRGSGAAPDADRRRSRRCITDRGRTRPTQGTFDDRLQVATVAMSPSLVMFNDNSRGDAKLVDAMCRTTTSSECGASSPNITFASRSARMPSAMPSARRNRRSRKSSRSRATDPMPLPHLCWLEPLGRLLPSSRLGRTERWPPGVQGATAVCSIVQMPGQVPGSIGTSILGDPPAGTPGNVT
jgi:hypothetical protein